MEVLILSNNFIKDKEVNALGLSLLRNKSLVELDLSENCISKEGCTGIVTGISANTSIKKINLSSNRLHNEGGKLLLNAILINWSITKLNLDVNMIDEKIIAEIKKYLVRNLNKSKYDTCLEAKRRCHLLQNESKKLKNCSMEIKNYEEEKFIIIRTTDLVQRSS